MAVKFHSFLSARGVSAITAGATLLAAAVFMAPSALVNASVFTSSAKSDLADTVPCEMQNWPYYSRSCLRNASENAGGRAIKPRIVSTDRLDLSHNAAAEADEVASETSLQAPASWMMSERDVSTYVAAGDFIRRTVR